MVCLCGFAVPDHACLLSPTSSLSLTVGGMSGDKVNYCFVSLWCADYKVLIKAKRDTEQDYEPVSLKLKAVRREMMVASNMAKGIISGLEKEDEPPPLTGKAKAKAKAKGKAKGRGKGGKKRKAKPPVEEDADESDE